MIFRAINIAFATYSRIPMPIIKNEQKATEAMPYAICFFPLIGAVIGGIWLLWLYLARLLGINVIITAVVATILPIIITGGIHMDGFCDITDAFSSWQTRERRLEILKDPHVGAFAIIGCCVYLLSYFGIMTAVSYSRTAIVLACTFMVERALSALALLYFKGARPGGMLDSFASTAMKSVVTVSSVIYLVIGAVLMAIADYRLAIVSAAVCALCYLWYRVLSYKRLGGTTGDMAGWFVQITELAVPVVVCAVAGLL